MQCYKHPKTETVLRCSKCERPICPACVVFTPVGARCQECARVQPLPQYQVSRVYLARAVGAALGIGLAVGLAMALADRTPLVAGNLRWLIHPLGLIAAGYLAGEGVSRATRRKRGRLLQGVAIAGVVVALATLIVLTQGLVIGFYTIVGFGVAVALAMNPLR